MSLVSGLAPRPAADSTPATGAPVSEQQFAAAFEFAPIGMALLAMDSSSLRVNHAMCQMLGYRQSELLGIGSRGVSHPEDLAEDLLLRREMLAGAFPSYQRDKRYLHKDGHVVWTHISCSMVHDPAGQPAHFLLQVQDITQRKAAEAALKDSEERYRATFEQAALGIAHLSPSGRFLRVNGSLCRMHGYARDELLHMKYADLLASGGDRDGVVRDQQRLLDGKARSYTAERRFIRKSGEVYTARVSVTLVRSEESEPYLISIVEDLTEHVRDQQRIREQAQMLDQASDAILVQGPDHRVRYWNEGAERLFGWTAAQAQARTLADLLGPDAVLSESAVQEMTAQGAWVGELRCVSADGRVLDIERRLTVIRSENGALAAVMSVNTDVTQRRRAEREIRELNEALESRIRQRTAQLEERNEELRTFAYSVAHDLRGPLSTTDGFSRQLELLLGDSLDAKGRHYLQRVRHGVQLMSDLTDALLSLANLSQEPLQSARVDLSALARAWLRRMRETQPHREVQVGIADTPAVQGDGRLLKVMLENLLDNAWKFTSRQPQACIEFGAAAFGSAGPVVFFVRDNGAGFDSAYAGKLFTPFQRLHPAHEFQGTGMGLAMVRKIALRHGGRVWADSRTGEGAVFHFTLVGPRTEALPE
ncbi:MAG TPA: PAS domain S-box protein [Ramlibacter sp.]|nr:PAS domain S-box protein [Ramlibacter sp.]